MGEEADWVGIAAMLGEGSQGRGGARNQDEAASTSPGEVRQVPSTYTRRSPRLSDSPRQDECASSAAGSIFMTQRSSTIVNMFNRMPARRTITQDSAGPSTAAHEAPTAGAARRTGENIALAGMERCRATKRKLPEGPRGRAKASRITKESRVPITQRIHEFKDQGFKLSMGKLFCLPCRETLQNLKESLKRHIKSKKHEEKLAAHRRIEEADDTLCNDLATYFDTHAGEKGVS